jgi:dynein heavy chain
MVITAGQIVWTHECEKALSDQDGAKKALRLLKKKWVSYLNKLTAITRSKLNKIERNKVCMCACTSIACSIYWVGLEA